MANVRLYTADPEHAVASLGARQRTVRAIMLERLTEIQYRRMVLLYGFDGPALTEREVAEVEKCARRSVRQSQDAAERILGRDWRMWLLWLTWYALQNIHTPNSDVWNNEAEARHDKFRCDPETGDLVPLLDPFNAPEAIPSREVEADRRSVVELRPSGTRWESDRYTGVTPDEAYSEGWLAAQEGGENPYRSDALREAWQTGFLALDISPFPKSEKEAEHRSPRSE